jgi:hypothetical protein
LLPLLLIRLKRSRRHIRGSRLLLLLNLLLLLLLHCLLLLLLHCRLL